MTTQERLETARVFLKKAIAESNRIMTSYWKSRILIHKFELKGI